MMRRVDMTQEELFNRRRLLINELTDGFLGALGVGAAGLFRRKPPTNKDCRL